MISSNTKQVSTGARVAGGLALLSALATGFALLAAAPASARPFDQGAKSADVQSDDAVSDNGPADDTSGPARIPKNKQIVVLFSGKQKEVAQNWIFQGSRKPAAWLVENGALTTNGDSIISKQLFLDFQLHVEFKTPWMPDKHGQERGNSGVGLLAQYEIQVLDSYGFKEPGAGDCGAVYSQRGPLVNACKPPRQWQTYDIVFHAPVYENHVKVKNARVSVFQNGICVQDNQDIVGATGIAGKETEGPGPIYLQYHNNAVQFRNVWVLPLPREGVTHYEPK